jgi:integrase
VFVPAIRINSRSRPVRKGIELLDLDETSRLDLRDAKRSSAIDPTVETSPAWTASKSPLSFQVRRFIGRTGHEQVILTDWGRGPAFYPTVFMTCCYDKTNKSANTREMVLRALGMARAWAAAHGCDLDYDLRQGSFLSLADAEALADHLMLSVEAQAAANTVAAAVRRPVGNVSKLERLRPSLKTLARAPAGLESGSAFSRIKWVAHYVEWHLLQRLGVADRAAAECVDLRNLGPQIVARLRERGRGDGRRSIENEALEGVPQEVIDLVSDALRPGDPQNPFTPGFVQARNELLWHLFISSGGRRAEVQSVLVKHVSFAQRRMYISQSKTQTRTVPISRTAADRFDMFVQDHWSKLPQAARKRGLLFTGQTGEPLSVRTVNRIFVTIRTRVPGCPQFLTPQTTRRSWNDRFSEMVDGAPPDRRMSVEQEMRTRNLLQGWTPTSSMGAHYANRHLRRKADELGEELANTPSKDKRKRADD